MSKCSHNVPKLRIPSMMGVTRNPPKPPGSVEIWMSSCFHLLTPPGTPGGEPERTKRSRALCGRGSGPTVPRMGSVKSYGTRRRR